MGALGKSTYPHKLFLFAKAQKTYFRKPKCSAELSNQTAGQGGGGGGSSWCGMYTVLIKTEEQRNLSLLQRFSKLTGQDLNELQHELLVSTAAPKRNEKAAVT